MLLVLSLTALGGAGWRVARAATESGLLRLLAAAALAAAAAALSALGLGLFGLGSSPLALSLAAGALWLTARLALDPRGPSAAEQLRLWWTALSPAGRAARGALVGATVAYGAWLLRHPALGLDALTDHLALPVDWVHNGRPGSLVSVNDALPYANYPNTHEVLVTWVTAIARTLVPALLLTPAALLLLAASIRGGLAQLGVRDHLAWLAAGAVTTLPIAVVQLGGPNTDVPATAWLACAAALAAGAARPGAANRSALFAIAIIAAGLAVGTKTTPAPLAVLALLIALWRVRADLRRHWRRPAIGLSLAAAVGGVWYIRNLIDHGSPLWPLTTTPWGDPIPPPFRALDASLLGNFSATLHGRVGLYELALAGGLVLVGGALTVVLWDARRTTIAGALVVLAALLIFANAPYTGISSSTQLAVGATRYLLPCLLAAAVTIALARRRPALAGLVLAAALGFNLDRDWILRFPQAPPGTLLLAGAAGGAALTLVLVRMAARASGRILRPGIAALATAVALVALLVPVDGYLRAHAATQQFEAGLVRWLDGRAAFRSGVAPVAIGPVQVAVLTGTRLRHPVILLGAGESCGALIARARRSWVVLALDPAARSYAQRWLTCLDHTGPAYLDPSFVVYAPPALRVPAS